MAKLISVATRSKVQFVDITAQVAEALAEADIMEGVVMVYVPHTTAGITINENADPDVMADVKDALNRLVPESGSYRHREGNAPAHVKAGLMGSSVSVPVENGRMTLGTWQGVYLCEFDGPRSRNVCVTVCSCSSRGR